MTRAEELAAHRALVDFELTEVCPHGLITVTVGAHGDLRRLALRPGHEPGSLATAILRTARTAAARAARQAATEAAVLLPAHADPGQADLAFGPLLHELDRLAAAPPPGAVPDYRSLRRELLELRARVRDTLVRADSPDGVVTATADAHGQLLGLILRAPARHRPDRLARQVLDATAAAGLRARRLIHRGDR